MYKCRPSTEHLQLFLVALSKKNASLISRMLAGINRSRRHTTCCDAPTSMKNEREEVVSAWRKAHKQRGTTVPSMTEEEFVKVCCDYKSSAWMWGHPTRIRNYTKVWKRARVDRMCMIADRTYSTEEFWSETWNTRGFLEGMLEVMYDFLFKSESFVKK